MAEGAEMLSAQDLIALHEGWKLTLWAAVFTRKPLSLEQIDQIVHQDRCAIGRWLLAQAETELGSRPEVVSAHEDFHLEMMQVASLLAHKDFAAAKVAIQEGSTFSAAGRRMGMAILGVNRVCRILAEP
jgi:hypothetical protein